MKDCSFTEEEVMSLTWGIYGSIFLFSCILSNNRGASERAGYSQTHEHAEVFLRSLEDIDIVKKKSQN